MERIAAREEKERFENEQKAAADAALLQAAQTEMESATRTAV